MRKSVVRKPGPATTIGALFSGIMREQSSRKATPCSPSCRGSKLPLLGRLLQGKHELSLSQSRVWLGEDEVAGDLLVGVGWDEPGGCMAATKLGKEWAALLGCHVLGTQVPGEHTGLGGHQAHGGRAAGTPCPWDTDPWRTRDHGILVLSLSCRSTTGTSSWGHPGTQIPGGHVAIASWSSHTAVAALQGPHPGDILGYRSL